jgi:hypothetical protein
MGQQLVQLVEQERFAAADIEDPGAIAQNPAR